MRLILECPEELVDPETIALGINLACSPRNVQIMCNGPSLKLLMRRALKSRDSLLLKMIRNISRCQGNIKKMFLVSMYMCMYTMYSRPKPQLSDFPDYPNSLLMKFIGFLVHFKWNQHSRPMKMYCFTYLNISHIQIRAGPKNYV